MKRRLSKLIPKEVVNLIRPITSPILCKVHRKKMIKLYSKFICPGDLVFDVGAHKGLITEIFLKLGAKVVCIEPQPSCIDILEERFGNNPNVTIINKGLGNKKGKSDFYICEKISPLSTFSDKWKTGRFSDEKWNKKIKVDVTTIDLLIKEFGIPKFCKIDVEGFEKEVLEGLNKNIPFISFEFHKEFLDEMKLCIEKISSIGEVEFNCSFYNDFSLKYKKWLNQKELFEELESSKDKNLTGDIYIRFK